MIFVRLPPESLVTLNVSFGSAESSAYKKFKNDSSSYFWSMILQVVHNEVDSDPENRSFQYSDHVFVTDKYEEMESCGKIEVLTSVWRLPQALTNTLTGVASSKDGIAPNLDLHMEIGEDQEEREYRIVDSTINDRNSFTVPFNLLKGSQCIYDRIVPDDRLVDTRSLEIKNNLVE